MFDACTFLLSVMWVFGVTVAVSLELLLFLVSSSSSAEGWWAAASEGGQVDP